jgi:uncharacterized membrane protein (UPF0127 family)
MNNSRQLCVNGAPSSRQIRVADTWWRRAVGLLATPDLSDPCGLLISPCNSVHTLGMRYAIDVLFLGADGEVLKLVPALKPLRAAGCRGAKSTLELRAGLAAELGLRVGMRLTLSD